MSGELIKMSDLAGHVADGAEYHLPQFLGHLELPTICGVQITRFMVVELAVAVLMFALFFPLAAKIKSGKPVRGRFWNLAELFLLYLHYFVYPCQKMLIRIPNMIWFGVHISNSCHSMMPSS